MTQCGHDMAFSRIPANRLAQHQEIFDAVYSYAYTQHEVTQLASINAKQTAAIKRGLKQ